METHISFFDPDLRNYDQTNEVFAKKLQRAQEAVSQTSDPTLVKTLSASFGTKWPYKRTMSAPASILTRQDSKLGKRNMMRGTKKIIVGSI